MESDIGFIIRKLREAGLRLYVEEGVARGEMKNGGSIPYAIMPFVDQYRAVNAEAVRFLTLENTESFKAVKLQNADILTAKAVKRAIQEGKVELIGRLIYHKSTNRLDITYIPKEPAFCLEPYREVIVSMLKRRLVDLEEQYEQLVLRQTANDWDEAKWREGQPERDALTQAYNHTKDLLMEGGAL